MHFYFRNGTNLKNLIIRSREYTFPIKIKLVVCNKKNAPGILYAKKNSIPLLLINTKKRNFENLILNNLKKHKISIICLAGYMKVLSSYFLNNFRKMIINIHPSLLPKFKGLNTFSRVIEKKGKKNRLHCSFCRQKP